MREAAECPQRLDRVERLVWDVGLGSAGAALTPWLKTSAKDRSVTAGSAKAPGLDGTRTPMMRKQKHVTELAVGHLARYVRCRER